jgi:L-alanine-DL-glutamate epimerase-like enolase superfamily enzyme
MKISISKKELELKVNWKLSRNETLVKENFFITAEDGGYKGMGEIAPNIRYGETSDVIISDFEKIKNIKFDSKLFSKQIKQLNLCHSFSFGLESALVHLESIKANVSVFEYLNLAEPPKVSTSYSVPIMEECELKEYLQKIERFDYIKIKVSRDNAESFVKAIARLTDKPLRIDGNEAWDNLESYLIFEKSIEHLNIQFIEQPMKSSMVEEYKKLKPISKFEIMADESIESDVDMQLISQQFHSVNIKLMKASGYHNAIKLLTEAKSLGLKTMIGCMIETSLGISSAINIASLGDYFDLDGSLLIKNDPYDLIQESKGILKII